MKLFILLIPFLLAQFSYADNASFVSPWGDDLVCKVVVTNSSSNISSDLFCEENGKEVFKVQTDEMFPNGMISVGGEDPRLLVTNWIGGTQACYIVYVKAEPGSQRIYEGFRDCSKGIMETVTTISNDIAFIVPRIEYRDNAPKFTSATIYLYSNGRFTKVESDWGSRFATILQHDKKS